MIQAGVANVANNDPDEIYHRQGLHRGQFSLGNSENFLQSCATCHKFSNLIALPGQRNGACGNSYNISR